MTFASKAGLATVLMASAAVLAIPAHAADLGNYSGSIKDDYVAQAPAVGPCYVRGDVGFSGSGNPSAKWPVSNGVFGGDDNGNNIIDSDEIDHHLVGDEVSNTSMENTWLVEAGVGCGSGSRLPRRNDVWLPWRPQV